MKKKIVLIIGLVLVALVAVSLFLNSATELSENRACALANAYLKQSGTDGMGNAYPSQGPDKACANFNPRGGNAVICVGGKTVVALQRYPKEGWKAFDVMLGAGCQ